MRYLKKTILLFLVVLSTIACSQERNKPWTTAIPGDAPFVIIPSENARLDSTLASSFGSFLDKTTFASTGLLSKIDSAASAVISLDAVLLYPASGNKLSTVWVTEAPPEITKTLKKRYYKDFAQNSYQFGDEMIQRLHVQDDIFYTARIADITLFSESSLGIEEAIRAYNGEAPRTDLSELSIEPGHILLNTPALDKGLRQFTQVGYHPNIKNAFRGTGPALLSFNRTNDQFQLSGSIPLKDNGSSDNDKKSALIQAISSANAPVRLDKYISSNAAAFGLFRQKPEQEFSGSLPDTSRIDSRLLDEADRYASIAQQLGQSFAQVLYAESGFMTEGEQLFLRKISDVSGFKGELASLNDDGLITKDDDNYYIQSRVLAQLLGSPLNTFSAFYLRIADDVAILSNRKELTEMVVSDKNRRRTMFYEQEFRNIKASLPEEISSLFVTNTGFQSFIKPFLIPDSYAQTLLADFDMLTASTILKEDQSSLQFHLTNAPAKKKVTLTAKHGYTPHSLISPAPR